VLVCIRALFLGVWFLAFGLFLKLFIVLKCFAVNVVVRVAALNRCASIYVLIGVNTRVPIFSHSVYGQIDTIG
jgi:hypothetical protein